MDFQTSAAPYPRKTSAFIPVVKNQLESPVLPTLIAHQPDRQEGIFDSQEPIQQDRNMASEENPSQDYYCMTCHQNFNIKISPCNHKRGKNPKYKCNYDDCKREFNIGSGLERHKLVHTGARPYECDFDQCDQKFNQKSNLNRHRRIHTQQKPFICEKCCKSFTTTTNLKQHVQVHFQDKEKRKKYMCQIKGCNKEYLYMCNLKKHKQEHDDPLSQCIGQRRPDFPIFSLTIGHCSFRIVYKRSKDHSELLITFRQTQNAVIYDSDHFSKVLQSINTSEEKDDMNKCMEQMETALDKLFETAKSAVSICFEMHFDLSPISNLLVKAAMGMTGTMGAKIFTVVVPSYAIFRDVVQNLLSDLQPE